MDGLSGQTWAITGAAGRIGSDLRQALAGDGVRLVSVDVAPVQPVHDGEQVHRLDVADVADLDGLARALTGCDGVVHLAGIPDEADFHDLAEINIVGTYHALEAARRAEVPRLVLASSNRVTGCYDVATTVDPGVPPRPDGFYGVSKVAGEALCRLYVDKFGLRTVALRIGSYEERPVSARHARTWLSRDDAARAFRASMTADVRFAVCYAVSANRELWWDLADGRALGFEPVDDAGDLVPLTPIPPGTPQGGEFATPGYSLERMHRR